MYLKAIEIYGFKSFANRVKIPLKPGVTCIVGPNGCGKSNVVDAIRWCIGEMSWKQLRLPSMMDVIFAGTEKRQPLNVAEVSMTFDNEGRKLPLDFSEVTTTRKIYRSDESEYFINRVQCRLKDIREMFLDTGIGADGYAIIDQGGVNAVLKANPEARRELFEEAAGVSKYKAKREEAIRRLEKVDQDLARLADSMTLIDEQIKKLESEARKAKLQQKYREELTAGEIALLVREIGALRAQMEEERRALEPVEAETKELSAAVTTLEAEQGALNLTAVQKQNDERLAMEAVYSLRSQVSQLEGKSINNVKLAEESRAGFASAERQERADREHDAKLEAEAGETSARLSELESGFEGLKAEYEALNARLAAQEQELSRISGEAAAVEARVTASYQEEMSLSRDKAAAESDITHLREDLDGLARDMEELAGQKAAHEARLGEISARLAEADASLAADGAALAAAEADRAAAAGELAAAETRLGSAREELSGASSRLEAILAQGEKDSYWVGINAVVNSGIQGVRGTLRHLLEVRKEDKLAVEETLGRFMDAVVVDSAEKAGEAIEYLRHLGKGRCRFIALDRVSSGSVQPMEAGGAQRLRERVGASPELAPLLDHLFSGVYLSGGSVHGSFWLAGGVEEVSSNEPYWGEADELKARIASLQEEITSLSAKKDELGARLSGLAGTIGSLSEKINSQRIARHGLEKEAEQERELLQVRVKNEEAARADSEKKRAAMEQVSARSAELDGRIEAARAASEAARAEIAGLTTRKAELQSQADAMREEAGGRKAGLEAHGQNVDFMRRQLTAIDGQRQRIKGQLEELAARKAELTERAARLEAEAQEARASAESLRGQLKERELVLEQLGSELNEMKNQLESYRARINEQKQLLSENEQRRHEIDLRVNTAATRVDDLGRRLADDWTTSYLEAKEKYGAVDVDPERVKNLRRRLENMGPINMTAPEEYEALTSRHNFMNSQVEDLNKAKADLRSAISKINETTRENFKATFDKVQLHFKQIYALLFNGGEASLILTQPDNLLETGVEIVAHPPGKKLISISQLSGGEQALTALALLFSFFCVNPSPFCIMDEADAPLDDANVERFVRLIKEFSSGTQFVVITHNKRTMEAADVLYGVTMEEAGVSKVISVDLRKAEALSENQTKKEEAPAAA
jgi:chromosome segregation protein